MLNKEWPGEEALTGANVLEHWDDLKELIIILGDQIVKIEIDLSIVIISVYPRNVHGIPMLEIMTLNSGMTENDKRQKIIDWVNDLNRYSLKLSLKVSEKMNDLSQNLTVLKCFVTY